MELWQIVIFVVFLGIVGYLLRDFFIAEGFQTKGPSQSTITALKQSIESLKSQIAQYENTITRYSEQNQLEEELNELKTKDQSNMSEDEIIAEIESIPPTLVDIDIEVFNSELRDLRDNLKTLEYDLNEYNKFYKSNELQLEERRFLETAGAPAIAKRLEEKRDIFHYGYGEKRLPVDAAFLAANPEYPQQLDKATYTPGDRIRISQTIVPVGGSTGPSLQDNLATCRAIQTPTDIPNINPASCGWYHVPDVNSKEFKSSYCVPGDSQGPNPGLVGLPTGGTWYWNKEAAIAAEAKKLCARETKCALQSSSSCAFCADVGHSLPYNRETGQLLYGGTCTKLYPTASSCPPDVTTDLCRTTTSLDGKKNCLQDLMTNLGIGNDGLLQKYVAGTLNASEIERMKVLLSVMNTRARWRTEILDVGNLDVSGTLDVDGLTRKLKKIVAAKTSYDEIIAGIAKHFVNGEPFNSAAYYYQTAEQGIEKAIESAQQTLALQDLQQEFRKAGCQAAGAEYPTVLPPSGSLADHRSRFQQLRFQMQNEADPQLQEDAIRRCLNSTLTFPPAAAKGPFCNEPGIEYLIYSPVDGPRATLIDRFISIVGLLRERSSYSEAAKLKTILETGPLSDVSQIAYTARTIFSIPAAASETFGPSSSLKTVSAPFGVSGPTLKSDKWNLPPVGTYTFRVNNQTIPTKKPGDDAPVIPYTPNQESVLEIQYTNNSSVASQRSQWGLPNYPWITQNLRQFRLIQESYKPFVRFDFSQNLSDANRIATLKGSPAFSPRFTGAPTSAPTGSPSTRDAYGLQEAAVLSPRIRSSLIQILDVTVFIQRTSLASLVKLVESDSYFETLTVERTQVVYNINNGAETQQFVGKFPNGFDPFNNPLRIVAVFTKKLNDLTVEFFYESKGLQSIGKDTMTVKGSLGFRRSLEIQLQPGIQKFDLYDRKSLTNVEGFQNPPTTAVQNSSSVPDILLEDRIQRRYEAEASIDKIDASTYIPNTILKNDNTLFTGAVNAPVTYADMTTGKCIYKPVSVGSAGSLKYEEKFLYDKEFINAKTLSTSKHESLNACYDSCGNTTGCVGMGYASDTGLCTFYETITNEETKVNDNFVSLIMPGKNKTVTDLQNRAKAAIETYKSLRKALVGSPSAQSSTNYVDTTKYGSTSKTITDADIEADLAAVNSTQDPDCLNAFLQKYILRSK